MAKSYGFDVMFSPTQEEMKEFSECIEDLMELEDVKRLADFQQHLSTNRLEHSLNVAVCSYHMCKRRGLDYRSAARAGLLHDLYHYNWASENRPDSNHISAHPRIALRTARKNVKLNSIEENSILRHMWPLTPIPPKYREGMLLSLADKYCCMMEVGKQLTDRACGYISIYKGVYAGGSFAK